jgi:pimeloyl-ACP methyl ester carboxylesterase
MTVRLACSAFGEETGEATPLVVLHGMFGSGRNWHSIAKQMSARRRVFTLDARNHGRSAWAEPMTYSEMVDDLRAFLDERGLSRICLLGHSMGGKTAMLFALLYGQMLDALVVVDIAPVAYEHSFVPFIRAMERLDLSGRPSRAELDDRLKRDIPDTATRLFLMQNLTARHGQYTWRINLAALGRHMADLTGFPDVELFVHDGAALFVSGANSDYVLPAYHDAITALFPQARMAAIEAAGHRVHAEQPETFVDTVETFLAEA